MAKQKQTKKQRVSKTSKGTARGAKTTPQTNLQKVLLGKGMAHVHTVKKAGKK